MNELLPVKRTVRKYRVFRLAANVLPAAFYAVSTTCASPSVSAHSGYVAHFGRCSRECSSQSFLVDDKKSELFSCKQ